MFVKAYYCDGFFAPSYFPKQAPVLEIPTVVPGAAEPVFVRLFNPNAENIHEARQALQRILLWLRDMDDRIRTLEEALALEMTLGEGPDGRKLLTGDGDELSMNVATWRTWVNRLLVAHEQSLAPVCILTADDDDHILAHDNRELCVSVGAYAVRLDARLTAGGH